MDDSEGIAARLDQAMADAVSAYRDPWKEAYMPATANQFASLLPVLG
jgi:nitrite reductase (NADH) large subunit